MPPQPPWLTAAGGETSIALQWVAPDDAPANALYRLYRSEHAAGPFHVHADDFV